MFASAVSRRRSLLPAIILSSVLIVIGVGGAPSAQAQECQYSSTGCPQSYTGDLPGNCLEVYRLYLPNGTPPAAGWPVLIHMDLSGFDSSDDIDCIPGPAEGPNSNPSGLLLLEALNRGIAVITAQSTISNDATLTGCAPCLLPTKVDGHGMFHPPGVDTGTLGFPAYDSPDYPMPEKDAAMLIQHVRHYAQSTTPHPLRILDHQRIAVHGVSSGAASLMWAVCGPERKNDLPFTLYAAGDAQFTESTRPDLAVIEHGQLWWPIFSTAQVLGVSHFGDDGDQEDSAPTMGDALDSELQAASALWHEALLPDLPSVPTFMRYGDEGGEGSICTSYTKRWSGCDSYDFCFLGWGQEGKFPDTSIHPEWSGYTWKKYHPASTRLVITTSAAWADAGPWGVLEAEYNPHLSAVRVAIVDWLVARFAELPSPWAIFENADPDGDLISQMIGGPGQYSVVPKLTGSGTSIKVVGGRPGAAAWLHVGVAIAPHVQYSGVLVPAGATISLPPLSPAGTLTFNAAAYLGTNPGDTTWLQVRITDGAAAGGFSLTNVVRHKVLP